MARLERVGAGMRLRLDTSEVEIVASLVDGLARRLADGPGADDQVVDRLAPRVSRDDEVDAELRGMLRGELITTRVERLRALGELLRSGGDAGLDRVLDRHEAMRMVETLNDLRVALAATVGYELVEHRGLAIDDPRADALQLLDALAWLQGGLIDYVEGD